MMGNLSKFFKDFDLQFEIRLKEIEEIYPDNLKAEEITNYLAELKAKAFEGELADNEILITSDTLVWLNDKALGKPKDYDDAFQILKSLSNLPSHMTLIELFNFLLDLGVYFPKSTTTGKYPV